MRSGVQIDRAGERAVVLSVDYEKTSDCVAFIRAILEEIRTHPHPAIRSLRPGLDALLIEYTPDPSFDGWLANLREVRFTPLPATAANEVCLVPVCYDFGYDLPEICRHTGLSKEEVVQLHTSRPYQVWMIGFMPGFPYLGELPQQLQMQRKKNPDPEIPPGSVAIAEEYTGIYPFQSPGGWHVIGRTPWRIVDYARTIPWTFEYGMSVRFQPISKEEFERLQTQ